MQLFVPRHDFDDPKLLYVMNTISYLVDTLATISVYDILPSSLRRVAGFSVKNFYDKLSELSGFFRNLVEEHKRTYDPNITRDFVDAWLKVSQKVYSDLFAISLVVIKLVTLPRVSCSCEYHCLILIFSVQAC